MIEKSLVRQYEDVDDRRKKSLELTKESIELLNRTQPSRLAVIMYLTEWFSQEEKETFLRFIEACMNKVTNEDEKIKSFHQLLVEA